MKQNKNNYFPWHVNCQLVLLKKKYKLKSTRDIEYLRPSYIFLFFHFLGNQKHNNNQRKSQLQQETWRSLLQFYIAFMITKHYKKDLIYKKNWELKIYQENPPLSNQTFCSKLQNFQISQTQNTQKEKSSLYR